ncbi:MAG: hypothetical protein PHS02_00665 [Candidatus ainarchaeum sp.]|nr:hypothetical protein [Candidatus ainarchaeum sp.]
MDLDRAFRATCKVLFLEEVGALGQFTEYLSEAEVGITGKSTFSGKALRLISPHFCKNARFFDYGSEYAKLAGFTGSLGINDIKDMDSLVQAAHERLLYAGNKVLGESGEVTDSDNVFDSFFVDRCTMVRKGKFLSSCYLMNETEYAFGSASSGNSAYIMRCFYNNSLRRCFECSVVTSSSDCYFCYNLDGCSDCMFSFHLRSARNCIGNVKLEREKYLELKGKLVGEMADGLRKGKRLPFSIIDMLNSD